MKTEFKPSYVALLVSVLVTLIGAAFIGIGFQKEVYMGSMASLGLISIACSLLSDKKGTYLLLFGIIALGLIFIPSFIPVVKPGFELDPTFSGGFLTSLLMIGTGFLGIFFSAKNTYQIKKKAHQLSAYVYLSYSILIVLCALGLIITFITVNGISAIDWEFLTQDVRNMGVEGGVLPALAGTLLLGLGTFLVAVPLGVGTAIYLQEYAKSQSRMVRVVRMSINILQGTPSIVHGLFGLAVFVPLFGTSLLSGCLILGFLTLPIVIRSAEEALYSVPDDLREASFALGATKWQTIRKAVIPSAIPGIVTGTVLGLGRAFGETAPIMFTAVCFTGCGLPSGFPGGLLEPVHALSYHLLELTKLMGYKPVEGNAWGTAFLLLVVVLTMNFIGIIIREKYKS